MSQQKQLRAEIIGTITDYDIGDKISGSAPYIELLVALGFAKLIEGEDLAPKVGK